MTAVLEPTRPVDAVDGVDVDADAWLTRVFTDYVESGDPVGAYAVRHPRLALRALRRIRELPAHDVVLPRTAESKAVADALLAHGGSRRIMLGIASVLRTPQVPGTFSDGPDKATLRRKARSAAKLGITIRPVAAADREHLLDLADAHERTNERSQYRVEQPDNQDLLQYDLWLAAYDAEGSPLMLAVTPHAGEYAVLRYFRTLVSGRASSDARYPMTDAVAEALAERGVRWLVDSARPHWLPNGLRHFQRMVGFRLVRFRSIRLTEA